MLPTGVKLLAYQYGVIRFIPPTTRSRIMDTTTESGTVGKDRLMSDIKAVVADAEELLKATASQTGEHITKARAKAEESLSKAKVRLADAQAATAEHARAAARATDDYVHENPWRAVGVAAVAGLLLGALISRR
jgi:ElaB/YqjD/DUF883 family membrane-anchored ribosome-binding protein